MIEIIKDLAKMSITKVGRHAAQIFGLFYYVTGTAIMVLDED